MQVLNFDVDTRTKTRVARPQGEASADEQCIAVQLSGEKVIADYVWGSIACFGRLGLMVVCERCSFADTMKQC